MVLLHLAPSTHRDASCILKGKAGATFFGVQYWGALKTGGLEKYVQIHGLDDSYNNRRVHCSYDLRLQLKKGGRSKFYILQRQKIKGGIMKNV